MTKYLPPKLYYTTHSTYTTKIYAKTQWIVLRIKIASLFYWGWTYFESLWREVLNVSAALFFFPRYSNIDMKTQEAYELAVKGLIRPMGKSPPIITAVRCLQFALPEFQLGRTGTECTGEL